MASYQYSLATDFTASNDIEIKRFISDIKTDASLAESLQKIGINGDEVIVYFTAAITKADLDTIVANHAPDGSIFDTEAIIKDIKASNTEAGTFTSGSWATRDLNTVLGKNVDLWLKLTNNEFTLAPGSYTLNGVSASNNVGNNQTRIYNITTDTPEFYSINSSSGIAYIQGHLEVPDTSSFRLEHRCQNTQDTNGFGAANKFGEDEIYTDITIKKVN